MGGRGYGFELPLHLSLAAAQNGLRILVMPALHQLRERLVLLPQFVLAPAGPLPVKHDPAAVAVPLLSVLIGSAFGLAERLLRKSLDSRNSTRKNPRKHRLLHEARLARVSRLWFAAE